MSKNTNVPPAYAHLPQWAFGQTKEEADAACALVLDGKKTATAAALYHFEEEPPPEPGDRTNSKDLVQRNLEIVRLDAQISKDFDTYQKLPRRRFIGARAQEYRFAQYVEDWRTKVERVGNLNYPQAARNSGIYGKLQLTVSIRADGSLENVEVSHSSQQPILDAAAVNIVRLAAPFSPLPANIRKDTDVLTITRTWTFTSADTLQSE